jgi:hypothetical protein
VRPGDAAGVPKPGDTSCGAAVADITPARSAFLFGYPHVPRMSTGTHDRLECAVIYLRGRQGAALFLANDLIYFARDYALDVRQRIAAATGVPLEGIMLAATHTHSGPVVTDNLSNSADTVVPKADGEYLSWLADRQVAAARAAVESAQPAEVGLAIARAEGVGTNRHDPAGPTDADVPVLLARSRSTHAPLGCLLVYGMHPTVLHEDSKLFSADFPGCTRRWLQEHTLSSECPVVYLQGGAGNQSPRHVTRANTFAEAARIGGNLARCIAGAITGMTFGEVESIAAKSVRLEVEPRRFPDPATAEAALSLTRARFQALTNAHAPRQAVRTAECDVFGAEKTVLLSRAAADGSLAHAVSVASPAEIQMIRIGEWTFVGWPGEFFVEHVLAVKARSPKVFVVTLANGELQGYIATPEAVARGAYEATNAIFTVDNGPRFVERTLALLAGRT